MKNLWVVVLAAAAAWGQSAYSGAGTLSGSATYSAGQSGGGAAAPVAREFFGMHVHSPSVQWQTVPTQTMRLWATSAYWGTMSPSGPDGNYVWTSFDQWIDKLDSTDSYGMITFLGGGPGWITANPSASCPIPSLPGSCLPPVDVNADGTGTDAHFIAFVDAFMAHRAVKDVHHRMIAIGTGNEPQASYWNASGGTNAQMARMGKDLYQHAKAADGNMLILSPEPSGGVSGPGTWFASYCADPSNPMQYTDVIAFHNYSWPLNGEPNDEDVRTLIDNAETALAGCPYTSGKERWVTEGGWGAGTWTTDTSDDRHAGWIARHYLHNLDKGVKRYYWFAWDNTGQSGLTDGTTMPNKAGVAYGQIYDWLAGATPAGKAAKAANNTWTMPFTRSGGYQALAVWNKVADSAYEVDPKYVRYRDLDGNTWPVVNGTLTASFKPVLLESGPAPMVQITTATLGNAMQNVAYTANLATSGGAAPYKWNLRSGSLPAGLTVSSGGVISGTATALGTFSFQVGVMDAGYQTASVNLALTVVAQGAQVLCGPPDYNCAVKSTDTGEPAAHLITSPYVLSTSAGYAGGPNGANAVDLASELGRSDIGAHAVYRPFDINTEATGTGTSSQSGTWAISQMLPGTNGYMFMYVPAGSGNSLGSFDAVKGTFRGELKGLGQTNACGTGCGGFATPLTFFSPLAGEENKAYVWTNNAPFRMRRLIFDYSAGAPGDPGRTSSYSVSVDSTFNGGLGYYDINNANCLNGTFPSTGSQQVRNTGWNFAMTRNEMFGGGPVQDQDMLYVITDFAGGTGKCRWANTETMQLSSGWDTGTASPADVNLTGADLIEAMQRTIVSHARDANGNATITYDHGMYWFFPPGSCTRGAITNTMPQEFLNVIDTTDASFNVRGLKITSANVTACSNTTTITYVNAGPVVATTAASGKVMKGFYAHGGGQVEKTGKYAVIGPLYYVWYNGSIGWDPDTNDWFGGSAGDQWIYHDRTGYGVDVYSGDYANHLQEWDVRTFPNMGTHTKVVDTGVISQFDDHIAWSNEDMANTLPFLASTWSPSGATPANTYEGELVFGFVAGPHAGETRRIAKAFGSYTTGSGTGSARMPECKTSFDGKWAICNSDYLWYKDLDGTAMNTRSWGSQAGAFTCNPTASDSAKCRNELLVYDLVGGKYVVASPTWVSVGKGGTFQFRANTVFSNNSVTWSATGGTITSGGLFTAGQTAGTYAVTATSVSDATKSATSVVVIQ